MDVFDLTATLTLDSSEYEQALGGVENKSHDFLGNLSGNMVSSALQSIGSAVMTGTAEVAKGVAEFTKQATDAYGDYEQLAGGIETLFGEASAQVMEDASRAFNEAGMSMNEYMETSIQSAAAMINSLGGDQAKASELMNMSIVDMSDNVNKMGTTMEAVQNAYRGFSRGNFTMLDNLALGFSGTKEGMQELLDKAQQISGIEYNIDSYSDIVQAIHVVQDEMGITGTTMKEAGSTITGSLGAVKSAWENLLIGLGNEDADLGNLMDNLIDSVFGKDGEGGFLNNIIPRIEAIFGRLPEVISALLETVPGIITEFLPNIINDIAEKFPELVASLTSSFPELVSGIVDALTTSVIPSILDALPMIVQPLADSIPELLMQFMTLFMENLPMLLELGVSVIESLGEGLASAYPLLLPMMYELIGTIQKLIIRNLPRIIAVAGDILVALVEGFANSTDVIVFGMTSVMLELVATIIKMIPTLIKVGVELISALIGAMVDNGIKIFRGDYFAGLLDVIIDVWNNIDWAGIGKGIIDGIINGITNGWNRMKDSVKSVTDGIKNLFTSAFDIHSPSKLFEYYGEMMMSGLDKGLTENMGDIEGDVNELNKGIESELGGLSVAGFGGDIVIPVYIGQEQIQTIVVDALNMANYRSGGR